MDKRLKIVLGWILDLFLGYVGYSLLGKVSELISNPLSPTLSGIVGLLSIIGVTALTVILIVSLFKKRVKIESLFVGLTVHYDGRSDTPEFITNNRTTQAYWVSDVLLPHVRDREIPTHHHKKGMLQTYFKEQQITVNARDPLPEELGLTYRLDKTLGWPHSKMSSDLLGKLNGKKLEDLKVLFLYPWYYYFISTHKHDLPNKALLLKISTKQAFEPPRIIIDLVDKEIVYTQTYVRLPFESLKKVAKRYDGYTYVKQCFTEKALLKEAQNN